MTVKVTTLDGSGHTMQDLTTIEVEALLDTEGYKYYIMDAKTRQLIKELKVEDGQELFLLPIITGGS